MYENLMVVTRKDTLDLRPSIICAAVHARVPMFGVSVSAHSSIGLSANYWAILMIADSQYNTRATSAKAV